LRVFVLCGLVGACCAALAQTRQGQTQIAFGVASLKPARPTPPYPVTLGITVNGMTTLTDVTLAQALMFAFGITASNQIVSPAWTRDGTELFDIVGKAPPETPPDKVRLMTLNLLTDRFKLTLHHEQREIPYYALVVDKKGPKLRETVSRPDYTCTKDAPGRVLRGHPGLIEINCATIPALIQGLEFVRATGTNRPIVDMTELQGSYDVKLEWTPQNQRTLRQDGTAGAAAIPESLDLFDAFQEQLGLRLEMRKGPMDVVIVDAADRTPEAN